MEEVIAIAIGVLAGLQVCGPQGTFLARCRERNALTQPILQLGASRLCLAPSDLAIAVGIQIKNQVKVSQVDIGPQRQGRTRCAEREVAVAARVRMG